MHRFYGTVSKRVGGPEVNDRLMLRRDGAVLGNQHCSGGARDAKKSRVGRFQIVRTADRRRWASA